MAMMEKELDGEMEGLTWRFIALGIGQRRDFAKERPRMWHDLQEIVLGIEGLLAKNEIGEGKTHSTRKLLLCNGPYALTAWHRLCRGAWTRRGNCRLV